MSSGLWSQWNGWSVSHFHRIAYVPNVLRAKSSWMSQGKLESLLGRRPSVDVVHQTNALEGGVSVPEVGTLRWITCWLLNHSVLLWSKSSCTWRLAWPQTCVLGWTCDMWNVITKYTLFIIPIHFFWQKCNLELEWEVFFFLPAAAVVQSLFVTRMATPLSTRTWFPSYRR
jgi:hypothetical protein